MSQSVELSCRITCPYLKDAAEAGYARPCRIGYESGWTPCEEEINKALEESSFVGDCELVISERGETLYLQIEENGIFILPAYISDGRYEEW